MFFSTWSKLKSLVQPSDIIIWVDTTEDASIKFLWIIGGLLILGELLSFVMVFFILCYLKKNASLFSKATYKLHLQFTLLLAIQVSLVIKREVWNGIAIFCVRRSRFETEKKLKLDHYC
jgi:hypothetical protein